MNELLVAREIFGHEIEARFLEIWKLLDKGITTFDEFMKLFVDMGSWEEVARFFKSVALHKTGDAHCWLDISTNDLFLDDPIQAYRVSELMVLGLLMGAMETAQALDLMRAKKDSDHLTQYHEKLEIFLPKLILTQTEHVCMVCVTQRLPYRERLTEVVKSFVSGSQIGYVSKKEQEERVDVRITLVQRVFTRIVTGYVLKKDADKNFELSSIGRHVFKELTYAKIGTLNEVEEMICLAKTLKEM